MAVSGPAELLTGSCLLYDEFRSLGDSIVVPVQRDLCYRRFHRVLAAFYGLWFLFVSRCEELLPTNFYFALHDLGLQCQIVILDRELCSVLGSVLTRVLAARQVIAGQ